MFHFQGKQTGRVGEGGLSSWDVEDVEEMEEEIGEARVNVGSKGVGEARVNVGSKGVTESSHFSK